jgi:hypothetical protein
MAGGGDTATLGVEQATRRHHGGSHRAVLAPAGCGGLVRAAERARLRGRPGAAGAEAAARPVPLRPGRARAGGPLRDRELLADPGCRRYAARRGRPRPGLQPPAGPLAGVPVRGAPLARRGHRRRRPGRGQPSAAERRPGPGAPPPRPGWIAADTGLGPGRARDGRDVELELGDLVAAHPRRPPGGHDPPPGRRSCPRMGGGHRHRPPGPASGRR